jgi:molybdopterin biosynthesis enzyme MoaB
MDNVAIIPTGDEMVQGVVLDTNSPALMEIILEKYPRCCVTRTTPVGDDPLAIKKILNQHTDNDLMIFIGGSGGGKRYDSGLAADVTHVTLDSMLSVKVVKEIYGYNGHLWSRLVIGRLGRKTMVANVPGPFTEALAAGRALIEGIAERKSLEAISEDMAFAVLSQYPNGGQKR